MRETPASLVFVCLRGGADGLALVEPHADPALVASRPTLRSPAPDDRSVETSRRLVDLDGRFGFHPGLAPLERSFREGALAVVHAIGSDDDTRSHFEAQEQVEHGAGRGAPQASGVFARHLLRRHGGRVPGLAAISVGTRAAASLTGIPTAAIREPADLQFDPAGDAGYAAALADLYRDAGGEARFGSALGASVDEAISVMTTLRGVTDRRSNVTYPETALGRSLATAATLISAEIGVEVITVDHEGWDTHFVQGQILDGLARDLGGSLAAFTEDLGVRMRDVCVVVLSEFGRRVNENVSLGTDHGRAGVAFVLGGGVRGGRVLGAFPGLAAQDLEPPGDLRVTTDYRALLASVLDRVGGAGDGPALFADYAGPSLALFG